MSIEKCKCSVYERLNKRLFIENLKQLRLNDAILNLRMFVLYNNMDEFRF